MKRAVAALITVGILCVILWSSVSVPNPDQPGDDAITTDRSGFLSTANSETVAGPAPEQCIQRMFEAAEQGDVARYSDCFTGGERDQLDRQLKVQSRDDFSQALIEAIRQLKGHAVHQARIQENTAEVVVERVYSSRNERQRYELLLNNGTWRIARVHPVEPFQPEIPYGTPVYQQPAESNTGAR